MDETEVVVAGHLTVRPERRDAYVADCADVVRQARATDGCLDFAITADTVEPDRVNIFERWRSRASVEAFRGDGPDDAQADDIVAGEVREFDVAGGRDLF